MITLPAVAGLPVDQHLGNLEGKELRFGTSAGATFAAATVDVTCGAVNAEHDSLNPIAGLSPFVGMWVNCIYGGKGVGMINLLLFLIIGIFLAGQMVGRTPEYLGKKIGAREVKLAMIALLIHPLLILGPSGLFAATSWGMKAESNPGAHGLFANRLPVLVGVGEQWLRIRRPGSHLWPEQQSESRRRRQCPGTSRAASSSCSAASSDHRADRDGGVSRHEEEHAIWSGNSARRHAHLRLSAARHHRDRRRACCSCRSPRLVRWPSIWVRFPSADSHSAN